MLDFGAVVRSAADGSPNRESGRVAIIRDFDFGRFCVRVRNWNLRKQRKKVANRNRKMGIGFQEARFSHFLHILCLLYCQ